MMKKKKVVEDKPIYNIINTSKLIDMIRKEPISLTGDIVRFGGSKPEKQNYFIYWTTIDRKALFETGNIYLRDDENSANYFKEAFEKKYHTKIPNTKYHNKLLENRIKNYI